MESIKVDKLEQAAYLVYCGCEIRRLDRDYPASKHVTLTLTGEKPLDTLYEFLSGKATVRVSVYLDCLNKVKDRVFAFLRRADEKEVETCKKF